MTGDPCVLLSTESPFALDDGLFFASEPSVAGDAATYDDVAVGFVAVAVDLVEGGGASPYKKGKMALVAGEGKSEM